MSAEISGVTPSSFAAPTTPLRTIAPESRTGIAAARRSSNLSSCAFIQANDVYSRIFGHCFGVGLRPRKRAILRTEHS